MLLDIFPEFKFDDNLRNIDEDAMKSASGKERWRKFIMPVSLPVHLGCDELTWQYEKRVTDYNFGTLIRRDCERAYDEDNAVLVTRVQFFGLEVSIRLF